MGTRTDGGWIRAGLAIVVTGILGGGVLTVARDTSTPRRVTADGVTGPRRSAEAEQPLDIAAAPPSGQDAPRADPVVGDKITVGNDGGSVTVSAVEDNVSAGRLFGAGPGQKYVAAEVKGCSGPHEKNLTFDPSYFMVKLDDGTMRDHGPGAKKPELDGGTVPAGKCLSGWVTFTVPDGSIPAAVLYDGSSRLTWAVPPPKGAKPTTTTTARVGVAATTTTTGGPAPTTPTTKPKATTTTTAKASAAAKASPVTTTTAKPAATTTTSKATTTTATTKPATTSTTAPKATTTTTSGEMSSTPTAPTG
jgi:hypothetical protein